MIINPFKPSQIATEPTDFYGREKELAQLENTLEQSSVVIQGIVGIGKSSLAYQTRLRLEGFNSEHTSRCIFAVCHKGVSDVDHLARLILERLVSVDETNNKVTWKVPWLEIVSRESGSITKYFSQGRHLQVLMKLLEKEYIENFIPENSYLIISIDEADKSPETLASFVRIILTESQGNGINNVRFLLSGVHPFFRRMLQEDEGMLRFFPAPLTLNPFTYDETVELLQSKFAEVVAAAEENEEPISVHPAIIERTAELSGGNPSLIQLLGSKIIDSERSHGDGVIDERDLVEAFRTVCYRDRGEIYNSLFDLLERERMLPAFVEIYRNLSHGFPAYISGEAARRLTSSEDVEWLSNNNVIRQKGEFYLLSDEMLRVRIALDSDIRFGTQEEFEEHLTLFTDVDHIGSYSTKDDGEITDFPPFDDYDSSDPYYDDDEDEY